MIEAESNAADTRILHFYFTRPQIKFLLQAAMSTVFIEEAMKRMPSYLQSYRSVKVIYIGSAKVQKQAMNDLAVVFFFF